MHPRRTAARTVRSSGIRAIKRDMTQDGITRREWIGSAATGAGTTLQALNAAPAPRPNIILLLADDMGWGDPSCYGNTAVKTPNIDAIAARGVRFENFYAASATCSPSRAAILTGRYPLRFDLRRALADDEVHLPVTTTLPRLLRQAGYATGHVGKWHLGGLHQKHIRDRAHSIPGPHQHGFDHYQCQNEEQPLRRRMGSDRTLFRKGGTCLIRDERNVTPSDPYYRMHFTDINGDEAVRLIEQFHKQGRPFFLNVWWLVPHMPYEPAPEPFWRRSDAPGISEDQRCFRSMVTHMDHKIGRILATLDELGIRDNTMVLFTSDNGGAYEANIGPYKGGKTDLHEGGIRVPGIVSWPARIPGGKTLKGLGHHCDLLPTFCAAAEAPLPDKHPCDGVNLLDALSKGQEPPERGVVFWQHDLFPRIQRHHPKPEPYAAEVVRRGRWKLMSTDGRPVGLFDLEADPLENVNLLARHARVADELARHARSLLSAPRDRRGFPQTQ